MTTLAYPMRAVVGDYARAAAGLVIVGTPLAVGPPAPVVALVLAAMALLFAVYGAKTVARHLTRIEVSERGVRAIGPLAHAVAWGDLASVKLAYYSTRRDRDRGWLQLRLGGAGDGVAVDSRLDGFDDLAAVAAREAEARGLRLDPATVANFEALGVHVDPPAAAEAGR